LELAEKSEIARRDAAVQLCAENVRHDRRCLGLDACAVSPPLHADVRRPQTRTATLGGITHACGKSLVRDFRLVHDGD
jgi:hypothetical protein